MSLQQFIIETRDVIFLQFLGARILPISVRIFITLAVTFHLPYFPLKFSAKKAISANRTVFKIKTV